MAVDAAESDGLPVEGHNTISYLYFADAYFLGDDFPAGIHDQGVEVGFFRVPQNRILYRDADCVCSSFLIGAADLCNLVGVVCLCGGKLLCCDFLTKNDAFPIRTD